MTSKDELFNIINDTQYGRIIFGDDSVLKVKGKGIVAIVALHVENKLIHGKLNIEEEYTLYGIDVGEKLKVNI